MQLGSTTSFWKEELFESTLMAEIHKPSTNTHSSSPLVSFLLFSWRFFYSPASRCIPFYESKSGGMRRNEMVANPIRNTFQLRLLLLQRLSVQRDGWRNRCVEEQRDTGIAKKFLHWWKTLISLTAAEKKEKGKKRKSEQFFVDKCSA